MYYIQSRKLNATITPLLRRTREKKMCSFSFRARARASLSNRCIARIYEREEKKNMTPLKNSSDESENTPV